MPHTNITEQPQLVTTKQDPAQPVVVAPGDTIDGQALKVQAAPDLPKTEKPKREKKPSKQDSES